MANPYRTPLRPMIQKLPLWQRFRDLVCRLGFHFDSYYHESDYDNPDEDDLPGPRCTNCDSPIFIPWP